MLRTRVIPVILLDGFSVLKTIKFKQRRNLGSPITVVRTYNTRNVDELIILDIDASKQNRRIDLLTIKDITQECFMPLTIGGGISSVEDIQKSLMAGADKVVLNRAALLNPKLIKDSAEAFGQQCIVASIDYTVQDKKCWVYDHHNACRTDIALDKWMLEMQHQGAGEIFLNAVDLDGTLSAPDIDTLTALSSIVNIPIIYVGGIASAQHCVDVVKAGAHAVSAASIFHFSSITPEDCRVAMSENGIAVR